MANWNEILKEWMETNKVSRKALAKETGMKYNTFKSSLLEGRKLSQGNRQKLYEATSLDCFKAEEDSVAPHPQDNGQSQIRESGKVLVSEELLDSIAGFSKTAKYLCEQVESECSSSTKKVSYSTLIKRTRKSFYEFARNLESIARAGPEEMKKLTSAISSRDIGYVTSLVNAVYKPDQFNSWARSSGYRLHDRDVRKPGGKK